MTSRYSRFRNRDRSESRDRDRDRDWDRGRDWNRDRNRYSVRGRDQRRDYRDEDWDRDRIRDRRNDNPRDRDRDWGRDRSKNRGEARYSRHESESRSPSRNRWTSRSSSRESSQERRSPKSPWNKDSDNPSRGREGPWKSASPTKKENVTTDGREASTPSIKLKNGKGAVKRKRSSEKASNGNGTTLLSFGDELEDVGGDTQFQGLGAVTDKEFKTRKLEPAEPDVSPTPEPASLTTKGAEPGFDDAEEWQRSAVMGVPKVSSAVSRGLRQYQEDRHVVVSCLHNPEDGHSAFDARPPSLYAVYDGHNGDMAAEIAKNKLHDYVAKAAPRAGLQGQPPEALEGLLRAAFASTEEEVLKEARGGEGERQDGTTASVVLLVGEVLVSANVGDSRAVLGSFNDEPPLGSRGDQAPTATASIGGGKKRGLPGLTLTELTQEHSPAQEEERERIVAAGGSVVHVGCHRVQHEQIKCRLAISRSLGDSQFKTQHETGDGGEMGPGPGPRPLLVSPEPSVKTVHLCSRDRVIVVASDGLWDVLSSLEAVEIALATHKRQQAEGGAGRSSLSSAPSWAGLTPAVAAAAAVAGTGAGGGGVGSGGVSEGGGVSGGGMDPAAALVQEAVERGTTDNVTVIVVMLEWD